jgi:hypothetical protein
MSERLKRKGMEGSNTKWRIGSFISLCLNSLIKISEGQKVVKFYSPDSGVGTILRGSGKEASGFTCKCKINKYGTHNINGKIGKFVNQ